MGRRGAGAASMGTKAPSRPLVSVQLRRQPSATSTGARRRLATGWHSLSSLSRRNLLLPGQTRACTAVALYVEGEQSTLEVILGSASLDELVDRLDSAERISEED